jgi:Mlc titration factor MtfA (ptsG expression regulator)
MLFSWWRRRRRRKLLAQPFPAEWLTYLDANVGHYRTLSEADKARLCDLLRVFIAEKGWEGCGGLEVTDEIKVTIAGVACLLLLGLEEENYFDRVQTILVYPKGYVAPNWKPIGEGTYLEGEAEHLGEAHYRGPVILSWEEVLANARNPGQSNNLVLHEFAHQLDMLDGAIDGTPPLKNEAQGRRWHKIMTAEFRRLVRASDHGRPTLLDHYGATDEAEFFAVATECFFDRAVEMKERYLELYELLRDYYRQDPAARLG